jgi:hypothetical protein
VLRLYGLRIATAAEFLFKGEKVHGRIIERHLFSPSFVTLMSPPTPKVTQHPKGGIPAAMALLMNSSDHSTS